MAWECQPGNIQKSLTTKLLCLVDDLQRDALNECGTAGICTGPAQLHADDLEDIAERTLKFADDKKFGGAVGTHRGRAAAQRDLGRLQERADGELMKFSKDKCNIVHVGRTNHLWEGLTLCNDTGWGAALLRRTWGSWQTASST